MLQPDAPRPPLTADRLAETSGRLARFLAIEAAWLRNNCRSNCKACSFRIDPLQAENVGRLSPRLCLHPGRPRLRSFVENGGGLDA